VRILFAGAIHDALQHSLRGMGHEPIAPASTDWYVAQRDGLTPKHWADNTAKEIERSKPDAFVLAKGFHYQGEHIWRVPPAFLWWVARRMPFAFACHDDPAATPIILHEGIAHSAHVWLTSCPGIVRLWDVRPRVVEWWLAWDQRWKPHVLTSAECVADLAVTGTPYTGPFPAPHFQGGWAGAPRREYVRAAVRAGFSVRIYGPRSWLDEEQGGDPAFAPLFHGWLHPDRIWEVHNESRVSLGTHLVSGHRYESGRIPFVCGAGGCLLHEHRPGLEDEFGGAVAWFTPGDVTAAIRKLRWLVDNPAKRDQMARAAQRKVRQSHTWHDRAATLAEQLRQIANR
jgi:hypothetical protein